MGRFNEKGAEYFGADDTRPFLFAVNAGLIEGHSVIHMYGINSSVSTTTDPEYIWDGQGEYNYPDSNEMIYVVSSDATDTGITIVVEGLVLQNGEWLEKSVEVVLNGTQAVLAGNFIRVFRMRVKSSLLPTGEIQATTGISYVPINVDITDLRAMISLNPQGGKSRGSTLMAMYTIPSNKTGFLFKVFSGTRKNQDMEFEFQFRQYNGSFIIGGVTSEYQSSRQYELAYEIVRPKTDIRVSVTTEGNNAEARASFHLLLVDNDKLPKGLTNV